MTRLIRTLVSALIAFSATAAVAATGSMTIRYKQSQRVPLGGQAANVVVSDPSVADVAILDTHSVIVLGKGYGSTDLLILDSNGHTLLDSQVTVVAPDDGRVTVYRGAATADFSCARRCQAITDPLASSAGPAPTGQPAAAPAAPTAP